MDIEHVDDTMLETSEKRTRELLERIFSALNLTLKSSVDKALSEASTADDRSQEREVVGAHECSAD